MLYRILRRGRRRLYRAFCDAVALAPCFITENEGADPYRK